MISETLLEILVCPETKQRLRIGQEAEVEGLNTKIRAGSLQNKIGETVKEPLQGLLIREDGLVAYAIRDDIPVMLVEEGIPLG